MDTNEQELLESIVYSNAFELTLIKDNDLADITPDEQAQLCQALKGIRERRAKIEQLFWPSCHTREDLDAAGATLTECILEERRLLAQTGPDDTQLAFKLAIIRARKNLALRFIKSHN